MTTRVQPWTPPRDYVELVEAGAHWDAVRAPAPIGERALALLGATGAVIADYAQLCWLVRPGSTRGWRRIRQVQLLGADHAEITYVGVPPITRTQGPPARRVPMGPDRYLTDEDRLREALIRAVVAELGPGEEVELG
ncbi:hypothetical protein ABZS71_30045 [Streptomyces sp. NPDC005393]|uniref:hypothetical protein n=1 Tax=Streptomyces sp. NPDC005393 TaxID=3157041 RepID=UPI0033ADEF80